MKLALHRSLTFWSGLLVIAFVSWTCRDSTLHQTRIQQAPYMICHAWSGWRLDYRPGGVGDSGFFREPLAYSSQYVPTLFPPLILEREADIPAAEKQLLQMTGISKSTTFTMRSFMRYSMAFAGPRCWSLFVPHWLLLALTMILWPSLLFLRARRRKRYGTPTTS